MVILVGPNGSGKSSLFEAFNFWFSIVRMSIPFAPHYHAKVRTAAVRDWNELMQKISVQFHGIADDPAINKKLFYFRSAYRHEADFTIEQLTRTADILDDQRRPQMMIKPQARVSDNYQRIVASSIETLFDYTMKNETDEDITDRLIGRVREAMQRVFPNLILSGLGRPLEDGTFRF
jgi:hypothetical protein